MKRGQAAGSRTDSGRRREIVKRARRVVLKIGSSVVVTLTRAFGDHAFDEIASTIADLARRGTGVVVVSSGAIATGMTKLALSEKPRTIPRKQAVAAVGQPSLMRIYEKAFAAAGMRVGQILLTHEDLSDRHRYLNARHTLTHLAELGAVPIVNENDTVAVEEIRFGDNDRLAAMITSLVQADLLVILTDQEGLYDRDPRQGGASLVRLVDGVTPEVEALAGEGSTPFGTGGMSSKLEAAHTAAAFGVPTIVARGTRIGVLGEIFAGAETGTLFLPAPAGERLRSRKHWLAFTVRTDGAIVVDDGARDAIVLRGRSLLPSGIAEVKGEFESGDAVAILDRSGTEFARGLTGYGSAEIRKIQGRKSSEIEKRLGYRSEDEVVHRDVLVVTTRQRRVGGCPRRGEGTS